MNIMPNQEELYTHPYAHVLLILIHHVLVYLERCVDEAPFGFVSEKLHTVTWVDIPHNLEERYVDYLHRRIQTASTGVYGVWMELQSEEGTRDVVVLTMCVQQQLIPFFIFVPVSQSHRWWTEREI